MNILETILGAQNGAPVNKLASQFGLKPDQASSALSVLVPALAAGLQRNMSSPSGVESLVNALSSGNHMKYIDDPNTLADESTIMDGNKILGHVFGSKDVSRQVAATASKTTGVDVSILKKMLPLVAAMVMGGMARQTQTAGVGAADPRSAGGAIGSMLEPLLRGGGGSILSDLGGLFGGMFGSRK
jgi:hypothetical protein